MSATYQFCSESSQVAPLTSNITVNLLHPTDICVPIHDPNPQKKPQAHNSETPPTRTNSISATPCNHSVEAFWLPAAKIEPIQIGNWVGSIESGANVNCNLISFCPHGCGTHTECFAHISSTDGSILDHTPLGPLPSIMLTLPFNTYDSLLQPQTLSTSYHNLPLWDSVLDGDNKAIDSNTSYRFLNPEYQPDDVIVGPCSKFNQNIGFIQSIQTILKTLQNAYQIESSFNPMTDISINTPIDQLIGLIPANLLLLLQHFSKMLIIRTFLPQTMLLKRENDTMSFIDAQNDILTKYLLNGPVVPDPQNSLTQSSNVIYNNTNPPYIPSQVMHIICQLFRPQHIISDLPSLDRENDGGMVLSHKIHFYDLWDHSNPNSAKRNIKNVNALIPSKKHTNTELCWFPAPVPSQNDIVTDMSSNGTILLCDLRVAPIQSDASPSQPLLYPILKLK
jgi:hypothetical protein